VIRLILTSMFLALNVAAAGVGPQATSTPSAVSTRYELKIASGKILYREKGSTEWKDSATSNDLVVIGEFDADHKIYLPSKAIKAPEVRDNVSPEKPRGQKDLHGQIRVWVHAIVDERGDIQLPHVDVSPNPEFSEEVLKALARWKFKPAKLNGKPVAVMITFQLDTVFM